LSQDIRNFEDQQKSLNEIVKVESESLKQQTINYRNGKSTFLDYSTALTDLGNSKQSLRTSQLTLKKLRAEALSLKGRLYENLIAK
jgi:outer membrane protein TolC